MDGCRLFDYCAFMQKEKIVRQFRKILIHIVGTVQKSFLGDDAIGIKLRMAILRIVGVKAEAGAKILGGTDIPGGGLTLGRNVFVNRRCYFDLYGNVTLADNAAIGHGVTFITTRHPVGPSKDRASFHNGAHRSRGDISVGEGVWIGANATILPGVTIGNGAVVAAGAVVSKNVEPNSLVAGVPAKVIKTLS